MHAWVVGDRSRKQTKNGEAKSSKAPINPRTGQAAKSNEPATWGTFDEAIDHAMKDTRAFGVGVNLLGSEFVGLDLDNVIDHETGKLLPAAADLINQLPGTYTERSPSGTGLRLFYRGTKPKTLRGCTIKNAFGPDADLEVYDGEGGGRYLTVTGNTWPNVALPIKTLTDQDLSPLVELQEPCRTRADASASPPPQYNGHRDDFERAEWGLIQERLLDPDKGYDNWFRIGTALKCLDDEGLRLWIEASRPSKDFDEAEIRRKWPGITGSSIASLFGMFDDVDAGWRVRYSEQQASRPRPTASAPVPGESLGTAADEATTPPASPIARLWKPVRSLSIHPTPRRWLLRHPTRNGQPAAPGTGDGLLLRGRAGQLVSAGGTGKTVALIQLAVSIIVRRPWFGHFQPDDCDGRVLLGLAEEDDDEVHRRVHDACKAMGVNQHEARLIEQRCATLALAGEDAGLLTSVKGRFTETRALQDLRQRLHDEAGEEGWAAVILDPLSRWGGINTDVDASAGTRTVQAMESLTKVPGYPAVLAAQHSSKTARRAGGVDSRGTTALTDGFRWEGSLLAKDGVVYFKQEKSNYSRPMEGAGIALKRAEGGILSVIAAGDVPSMDDEARDIRERLDADVEKVVAGMTECAHTASSIDQVCSIAGIGKPRGRVAVRQALSLGRLIDLTPRGKIRTFMVPGQPRSTPTNEGGEDPHTPAAGAGVQEPTTTRVGRRPAAPRRRPPGAGVQDFDGGQPEQSKGRRRAKRGDA